MHKCGISSKLKGGLILYENKILNLPKYYVSTNYS